MPTKCRNKGCCLACLGTVSNLLQYCRWLSCRISYDVVEWWKQIHVWAGIITSRIIVEQYPPCSTVLTYLTHHVLRKLQWIGTQEQVGDGPLEVQDRSQPGSFPQTLVSQDVGQSHICRGLPVKPRAKRCGLGLMWVVSSKRLPSQMQHDPSFSVSLSLQYSNCSTAKPSLLASARVL